VIRLSLYQHPIGGPNTPIWVKPGAIESFYTTERAGGQKCTRITLTGSTIFDVLEAPAELVKAINGHEYREPNQKKLEALHDAIQADLENDVAWINDLESRLFASKYPRITAAHTALLEDLA
jgi:hypothetical protein